MNIDNKEENIIANNGSEKLENNNNESSKQSLDDGVVVDKTAESNDLREALGEKFRAKITNSSEDLDEDEDVKEFINQKEQVVTQKVDVKTEQMFNPAKPSTRTSYVWTIILIILIIISLTAIVMLVLSGRGGQDLTKQQQLLTYNEQKSKYDKIFVGAVNKLNEAEADFNAEEYVKANDLAKEAQDDFSEAIDSLYEVGALQLDGEEFGFLSDYFDKLREVTELGENMANTLSYVARSADRGEYKDAEKNLVKYHDYADDMSDLMAKLDVIKKNNNQFFKE